MATNTKPRAAGNSATATAASMAGAGTDAIKDGFEQAARGYDQLADFSRENIDAWVRCANAAAKGMEVINAEALTFSRQSMEEGLSAARQVMTAKTVQEWFELQSGFTKSALDSYMGQVSKFSDLFASTAREAMEPLNGRLNAFVDLMQSRH